MKMPIYHTRTTPSMELRNYLSELASIAALAKAANQTELYNQAKEAHDNLVTQYNTQNRPKKKGFWGQFKDNLLFRDMDTHIVDLLEPLEGDPYFQMQVNAYKNFPIQKLNQALNETIQQFNSKHK